MPVVKESESLVKHPVEPMRGATIAPKTYKHSIVDSNKTPIDSLLTQISGMRWVVDYYSQILGEDEEPKDFAPGMTAVYQSYDMIQKYELMLQSELASSNNENQDRWTVSGTAITYPKLKPNRGDIIIGDVGDGRAGRFTVKSVQAKTIYNNSCYEIEFELVSFMDEQTELMLKSRVVKTAKFVKDFMLYGQNPVLIDEEYALAEKIEKYLKANLSNWLNEFYSYDLGTILVPYNGTCYVYDPFVATLITKLFTPDDNALISKINLYDCDGGVLRNYTSIWDAILSGEVYQLENAFKQCRMIPRQFFNQNIFLRNIYVSRIDYVMLPTLPAGNCFDPLNITRDRYSNNVDITTPSMQGNRHYLNSIGLIMREFGVDDYYVVSDAVYNLDDSETSSLEQQLRNYFQQEHVDLNVIFKHLDNKKHFSPLQRFYLVPLCLLMLINGIRSI